jgi:hypothetical protein
MGAVRQRTIDRLLEGLGPEERTFVLDFLADHGTSVSDDLFLPAALTVRLIIEQQRFSDRLRDVVRGDVKLLQDERAALHADVEAFRAEVETMRRERPNWLAAARESIVRTGSQTAFDIERRVDAAIAKLSAAVDEPIAPIHAAVRGLPESVGRAASGGAAQGVRAAQKEALADLAAWARARVLLGVGVLAFAVVAAFFIGRFTSSIGAPAHVTPAGRNPVARVHHT